jgi:Flp pilus assembly protein TadG
MISMAVARFHRLALWATGALANASRTGPGSKLPRRRMGLASFASDQRGLAFVEFALITPVMLILMLGTLEMSLAYTAQRKMARAAATIADLIAQETSPTGTSIDQILDVGPVLIAPFAADRLSITASYVVDDGGTPSTSWQCWNGVGSMAAAPTTLPEGVLESGGSVLVVNVGYEHHSDITKLVIKDPITFSDTFYAKIRQSVFGSAPSGGGCV